jgi:predicted nucleic acid-binding protein
MRYIIDSSFCVALIMPDEKTQLIDDAFSKIKDKELIVPQLWWYEVGNVLRTNVKRKRLDPNNISGTFRVLSSYNIITDAQGGIDYIKTLFDLALKHDLSVYDASYLELGIRKQATVCTLDGPLKAACVASGLPVML